MSAQGLRLAPGEAVDSNVMLSLPVAKVDVPVSTQVKSFDVILDRSLSLSVM